VGYARGCLCDGTRDFTLEVSVCKSFIVTERKLVTVCEPLCIAECECVPFGEPVRLSECVPFCKPVPMGTALRFRDSAGFKAGR